VTYQEHKHSHLVLLQAGLSHRQHNYITQYKQVTRSNDFCWITVQLASGYSSFCTVYSYKTETQYKEITIVYWGCVVTAQHRHSDKLCRHSAVSAQSDVVSSQRSIGTVTSCVVTAQYRHSHTLCRHSAVSAQSQVVSSQRRCTGGRQCSFG